MASPALVSAPVPEVPMVEKLAETQIHQPAPMVTPEPAGVETLLRSLLSGQRTMGQQPRQGSFRRDWIAIVCYSCGKAGHSVTHCPVLDESFPFMLPGWRTEKTPGGYIMISPGCRQSVVEWKTATDPGGGGEGGGFAARISSKIRPQDPGGGAARIAAPRGVEDMEVTSSSVSSVVEPQSVPSRISVVLVEEAKVMGTEYSVSLRLLSPAGVTFDEGGNILPCVVGTLSPSDSDSVGPCGTLSLSESVAVGPVAPDGTPSPSDSDSVGPIGPYGTLSPCDSDCVGPVGPYGTLSPCDSDSVGPYGRCPRLTLLLWALWALMGRCPHPTLPEYCFRPYLLGYCSQWTLLAILAHMGRCPCLSLLL